MPQKKPKILYGIQSTGCGHLARALEILPVLRKRAQVDLIMSGAENDFNFPYAVKYRPKGVGITVGRGGAINFTKTLASANVPGMLLEAQKIPIKDYDLVVTDFEPICAWAARMAGVRCVGLGNQYAFMHPDSIFAKPSLLAHKIFVQFFTPCKSFIAFDFRGKGEVFTPLIRQPVRKLKVSKGDHFTVYLSAYTPEEIEAVLKALPSHKWEVFSSQIKKPKKKGLIQYAPLDSKSFLKSFASCRGIVTAAGFNSTSEALFLQKPLLVVPMKAHPEQKANATALRKMGVWTVPSFKLRHRERIAEWMERRPVVEVDYPDLTEEIVERILQG